MNFLKTPVAARELGVGYYRLLNLMRLGKLTPPAKDSSGDYIWTDEDLEAARFALTIDFRRKTERVEEKKADFGVVETK